MMTAGKSGRSGKQMDIGIVGGGINGLCCAWVLQQQGHAVHLYERDRVMAATSSNSSKLLHGGPRYLENLEFRLVREALRERDAWLARVPEHTQPLQLVMPVYQDGRRPRRMIALGLFAYEHLAGNSALPPARWLAADQLATRDPALRSAVLRGGYEFSDGQMDDHALGLWVAGQAVAAGAVIREHCAVRSVDRSGRIRLEDGGFRQHQWLINACGPWAQRLLEQSGMVSAYQLDLVRGSHLILDYPRPQAYLLEGPAERRIVFLLPWKGKTLVGTTEVRQSLDAAVRCEDAERRYLLALVRHHLPKLDVADDRVESFSGLRPLLRAAANPGQATREYALHRDERLITAFGGKGTTACALARKLAAAISG